MNPLTMNPFLQNSYRQEVIKNFIPTIKFWANHYHFRNHKVLDLEDLVMAGIIGLIDAMNKFNHKRKNQFKTYAEFRIRGEIIDELRKQDWMSRTERNKQKLYRNAKLKLSKKLGRSPTRQEIINSCPLSSKDFSRMEQYESGSHVRLLHEDQLSSHGDFENMELDQYALKKTLSVILDELPRRMRLILVLKYFEDLNFYEISKVINLSEGRICQLHAKALHMLKDYIEEEKIDLLAS